MTTTARERSGLEPEDGVSLVDTLRGRHVVVIGGSGGIGLATARLATRHGARVTIGGRSRERLEAAIERLGPCAQAHVVDTSDGSAIDAFFDCTGPLDHLVTTAATYVLGSMRELSPADARTPFESKFWGQYLAVRAALPQMADNGSVVLVSGADGARPTAATPAYTACNAAIEGLARGLAVELSPIRVNAISPGAVDGALWARKPDDVRREGFERYRRGSLLGKLGTEEHMARAVLFLFGHEFMTGSVVSVDGGFSLR
jgi:NAD(P)-dependent dehydrogenase (short-subunit alcohol dehydrogenase family)